MAATARMSRMARDGIEGVVMHRFLIVIEQAEGNFSAYYLPPGLVCLSDFPSNG